VETADQLLFLRAAGMHSMQDYRFGKAVSVEEISSRAVAQSLPAYRTGSLGELKFRFC
jgi:EAL domain-containing protein (putative c-di-GMP-specific phosphodiesterase class I)